jgi:hypothetical protein
MAGVRFSIGTIGFFHSTASKPALGPTQAPTQLIPGTLSLRVNWPESETGHSHIFIVEVKNVGAIPPFSYRPSWRGAKLIKYRGN